MDDLEQGPVPSASTIEEFGFTGMCNHSQFYRVLGIELDFVDAIQALCPPYSLNISFSCIKDFPMAYLTLQQSFTSTALCFSLDFSLFQGNQKITLLVLSISTIFRILYQAVLGEFCLPELTVDRVSWNCLETMANSPQLLLSRASDSTHCTLTLGVLGKYVGT